MKPVTNGYKALGRAINLVHEIKSSDRLTVQVQRGDKLIDYRVDVE